MSFVQVLLLVVGLLALVALYDVTQKRHAILRNYPIVGHLRYLLEGVGPELRQYIVTDNDEERPFSRDQRSWIYASAKQQNNLAGFGTDNDLERTPGYLILRHATFPHADTVDREAVGWAVPCAKVLGGHRQRRLAFRPTSIINTSAMSFGSLSGPAVEALNRGGALAGYLQNTGEGGISPHHDQGGGLIWQIGTGYFGCRTDDGAFSLDALQERIGRHDVRALEIKLSQGAKPGHGGVLPGAKVTAEIAAIRGVPIGKTVLSPPYHTAFSSADELLDFVEHLADATGLPVGIKSAVGEMHFWHDLAELMATTGRGVDHIQIDGGEGGTGAAPRAFSDHVAMPFKQAFPRVYQAFAERGIAGHVVWIGSGRLGLPEQAMLAMGMGCDLVAVAREAMLSIGCIQAQRCHTGRCPTGVATQSRWLTRGLDPASKAVRAANYVIALRQTMLELSHAMGKAHPALVPLDAFELLDDRLGSRNAAAVFGYAPGWGLPPEADAAAVTALMAAGGVEPVTARYGASSTQ
ncbi:MAG: FMN-binding glutamate synthase family protein [Alphaproteobacteria bacterium]|nr:FMN-binding glutamate synthase family protein [Alphaproteobacteria bacterium]